MQWLVSELVYSKKLTMMLHSELTDSGDAESLNFLKYPHLPRTRSECPPRFERPTCRRILPSIYHPSYDDDSNGHHSVRLFSVTHQCSFPCDLCSSGMPQCLYRNVLLHSGSASGIWRRLPGISFTCDRNSRRGGLWGFTRMQHYQYDSTPSKPYKQGIASADAWPPNKSAHVCEHRKRGIVRAIVWLHSKTKGKRLCVRWSILVYQYGTCCHT